MSSNPVSVQPTPTSPTVTTQIGAGVEATSNLKSAFFMSWPVYASLGLNGLVTALGGPLTNSYNPQELALAAFLCGKVNPATTDVFTGWEVAEQILALGSTGQVTSLSANWSPTVTTTAPDPVKAASSNSPTTLPASPTPIPTCPAAPDHANTADDLATWTPSPFTAASINSVPAEPAPTEPVNVESSYRLFRQYLREYLRSIELSQEQLARLLYTDPKMLSRRLNLSQGAFLTLPEARRLILKLADIEALSYQWQALELLQILYPTFATVQFLRKR